MTGIEKPSDIAEQRALRIVLANAEMQFWAEWRNRVNMQIDAAFDAAEKGEDVELLYPGGKKITLRPVAD